MPFFPESVIGKRQEKLTAINCISYLQHRKISFSFVYVQNNVGTAALQRFCSNTEYQILIPVTEGLPWP